MIQYFMKEISQGLARGISGDYYRSQINVWVVNLGKIM
jgi:hypothetical protein